MNGLIAGRIVHYVNRYGAHYPAMVVAVLDNERGAVELASFEGPEMRRYNPLAGEDTEAKITFRAFVSYSENLKHDTWHWIENEESH